jgi:hypothetical protein
VESKVVRAELPAVMFPVSHIPATSLVEVWVTLELLYQVTVVCTATVRDDGLNVFPAIATVCPGAGVPDDGAVGLEDLSLQPIITISSKQAVMMEMPKNILYILNISSNYVFLFLQS